MAANIPGNISPTEGPRRWEDVRAIAPTNCTAVTFRSTGTEDPHEGEMQSLSTPFNTLGAEVGMNCATKVLETLLGDIDREHTNGDNCPLSDCNSVVLEELSKDSNRLWFQLGNFVRCARVQSRENSKAF